MRPAPEQSASRDRPELPPELRLLMATVRDEHAPLVRALGSELDWPLLVLLSEDEKATPILHARLAALRREGVPLAAGGEALDALERLAMVHGFRQIQLDRRLEELIDALHSARIPFLLLKGAALRRTVYRSPTDRPMGDVDLLVEEDRAEAARDVARAIGWLREEGGSPDESYRSHHHLPPLVDDTGLELGLEIHTALLRHVNPFRFSAATLWREARPPEGDPRGLVPRPEHLLLHAALHFGWSHEFRFGAWRTFRDVDALVESGGVDWDLFVREAHEGRAAAAAFWTLHLAREWANVPVDDHVLDALRPPVAPPLLRALSRHFALLTFPPPGAEPPAALTRTLWALAMRPGSEGHGRIRPWTGKVPIPDGEGLERDDGEPEEDDGRRSLVDAGLGATRHLLGVIRPS